MRPARHAWAVVVVTVALAVAQAFLLAAADVPLLSAAAVRDGFPGIPLATVVGALVGAVILSRHPRHRVGWLFCAGQLGAALGLAARAAGDLALAGGRFPQAGRAADWVGDLLGSVFALMLLAVLLLLAPDGRLPSPRWRPALLLTLGSYAVLAGTLLTLAPPSRISASGQVPATPAVQTLVTASNAGVFAGLAAGAAAVVVRLRRARGEERQQMRWIAVAAVGLAAVPVVALALNLAGRPTPTALVLALHAAYLAVPVATGFAVLRYRLYDVDRVIGGAVVLTAVVVVASAGYLAVVASVGRVTEGRGRPSWLALGTFVAVVLLLQPVRRAAGLAADRLVYGPRAARYAVLVAHSDQLADAAAGHPFLTGVAQTTARLMGASSCRAAVRLDDGSEVSEVWPPGTRGPGDGTMEVPVRSDGADVGRLVLELRQPAAPSASRRRVLREFCERAGPAFRTTGLEESLRAGATRLAHVNADLAASRQRLLAADDSGRRQVAAAIRVGVVSGLREVPDRLSAVAAATRSDPPAAVRLVDACIATTTDALDQLREITRAISPPLLAERGLHAALQARGSSRGVNVHVDRDPTAAARWPADVEACAWFCCTELLRGARGDVRVVLASDPGGLVVTLAFAPDDGPGGPGPGGPQLEGAADRIEALGGTLVRQGRDVRLTFPVREQARPAAPLPLPTPE
jgi:signal transduction histidine kinase